MPTPLIETQRLYARRWEREDIGGSWPTYAKPEVMRHIPGGVWDRERTALIIARMIAFHEQYGFGILPVFCKEDNRFLGHCGFNYLQNTSEIEIAYIFDSSEWGSGFATEIARAILAHGFAVHELERVVAVAYPQNLASIRVMQKIGMEPAGTGTYFGASLVKYQAFAPGFERS